jgi:hypothetical protein
MGMSQSFPDDRPVIPELSRYVIPYEDGRPLDAITLGHLILARGSADVSYMTPGHWNANIVFAREAFADYCRRRGL